MDQQQFDRIIREQLQELRPDFRPELWDRMEQALDAEDALLWNSRRNWRPVHSGEAVSSLS